MIPISDSVRTRRFPWVNLLLILSSVLVFLWELAMGSHLDAFVLRWGANPALILPALTGDPRVPHSVLWTLVSSQFIHAGWAHLLGNMLFLWVFGRAVEDRIGHFFYLTLYLVWGIGAAMVQIALTGPVPEPLIGASGAVSGVLGAYFILFPGAWVSLLVPIFFFFWVINVPALLVLGYWFMVQFLNGAAAITRASQATGGIAFWAHVGGFLLGMAFVWVMPKHPHPTSPARPAPTRRKPQGALRGVARALSTVADVLALIVVARVLLLLAGLPGRGISEPLGRLLYALTTPLVEPFAGSLPTLLVNGREVELFSIAAIVTYWATGAFLAWVLEAASNRR